MVEAIHELQDAGVEPDLWKIEGLDRRDDCKEIVTAARAAGRDRVSCIVLGRGEDDQKVRNWLAVAASVPGFIGFAVGRTTFWDPLVAWRSKKATREQTVAEIARRYREFVGLFERADLHPPSDHSGNSPSATATGSFATGTDGSNRSPSASESVVNERQIEFGEMRRGEFGRLPAQDVGGGGDSRSRPPAAGTLKYRESCGACVAGA